MRRFVFLLFFVVQSRSLLAPCDTLGGRRAFQRQYHWGQDRCSVRKKASRNIGRLPGKENTALVVLQRWGPFWMAEGCAGPLME